MDEETALLLGFLDGQRQHVTGILEGFSEDQLRRPVLPLGWSCLGLVRHHRDVDPNRRTALIPGAVSVIPPCGTDALQARDRERRAGRAGSVSSVLPRPSHFHGLCREFCDVVTLGAR